MHAGSSPSIEEVARAAASAGTVGAAETAPLSHDHVVRMRPTTVRECKLRTRARRTSALGAPMSKVLVVEDTESLREVICTVLQCEGYEAVGAASAEEGLSAFQTDTFALVLADLKLPQRSGLEFLRESKVIDNTVPVVVMTAYGNIDIAVQAMKLGATDFIAKPFDPSMLCNVVSQVLEHRRIIERAPERSSSERKSIVTQSPNMEELLRQAAKVAPLSTPVLIIGESGTGKELLARYIHQRSPRSANPFVAVNCGSTPNELLESEFFGHEAGAFTGATERRLGLFEVADTGTIFLDEVGTMPSNLQVKLLRTLQESEIKRIGSNTVRKVDTRIISATNCDIESEVQRGTFRGDLYYRLGVVVLEVPALRERAQDIPLLANYFVKTYARSMNMDTKSISEDALELLKSHSWPGNVRELENVIARAMIFAEGALLTPECFALGGDGTQAVCEIGEKTLPEIAAKALRDAEISAITNVMARTGGNKTKAARILGVSYKTLLNKCKEYNLDNNQNS